MNNLINDTDYIKQKRLIKIVSIVLPIAVATLFGVKLEGYNFQFLPKIYASINGLTSILLIVAVMAAKNRKFNLHEMIIKLCMLLSIIFLLLYIVYHGTSGDTKFGGDLTIRNYVYFPILISHIILSIGVVPLVLYSYLYGSNGMVEKHRNLVKKAFPIWLYVTTSGVIVYLMISPYYII